MRAVAALFAISIGVGVLGCVSPADPLGRNDALQTAQRRYTESIRWGDLEKAARYVDPELRDEFLALVEPFEQIRITDFEIGEVYSEDHDTAEVEVTYRAYTLPHFVEKRVHEQQEWVRDSGLGNVWHVRPQLALLVEELVAQQP